MILHSKSQVQIVLPSAATLREEFAASEISKYFSGIFGISSSTLTTAPDGAADAVFVIGGPERNAYAKKYISEADFKERVPGPEGFLIQSLDCCTVLIAGSSWNEGECERGTVYAVYEFLERFLGCSLSAYSNPGFDAGEYIPRLNDVSLDGIYYAKPRADLPYRTAIVQYSNKAAPEFADSKLNVPFFDWLVKNRYNRILTWASIYEVYKETGMVREAERRGIRFSVGHHESSRLFLPAEGNKYFSEHYYKTHPEYYKLLENGERFYNNTHTGQWVYCSRNGGAIKELAKNISLWLAENPTVDVIALWPNDGVSDQCCCPACKPFSKTENYCYFANEVIKLVKKSCPHIKFDMLVYVDLWECPKGLRLDSSVIIDESTWCKEGLRTVGKPDGSCINGTSYEQNLMKWKEAGAEVVYYDYYMGGYGLRQRWIPMSDEIQQIWQNFIEKGISGAGTQIECFNLWNHLFNFCCFGRTGYDTRLSLEDNLNVIKRLFGEGGDEICEIVMTLEDVLNGQARVNDCGHYLMEHVNKEEIYTKFEKAISLAKTQRARNNIRLLRMVFRYSDLETREPLASPLNEEFNVIETGYDDPTGELGAMSDFDSFRNNDPGFAITIPLKSKNHGKYRSDDKWYCFE